MPTMKIPAASIPPEAAEPAPAPREPLFPAVFPDQPAQAMPMQPTQPVQPMQVQPMQPAQPMQTMHPGSAYQPPMGMGGNAFQGQGAVSSADAQAWRNSGFVAIVGAAMGVIGFFLPWIKTGGAFSSGRYGSSSSGWSVFYEAVTDMPDTISNAGQPGSPFYDAPGSYAFMLILWLVDLVAIILVPLLCLLAVYTGYKIVSGLSTDDDYLQKNRLGRVRLCAIFALIPVIAFFLILQGLLGYDGSGGLGVSGDSISLGFDLMGAGFWMTLIVLLAVIFSRLVLMPKNNR
jgi:hypothetical protein